jgi:hypothetical protein
MRVLKSMKTVDPTYRRLTRSLFLSAALALPFAAHAHEDHGAAQIIADAQVISLDASVLTLKVSIYNRAPHVVTLFSVLAPGAAAAEALFVTIEGSGQAEVDVTLSFEGPIPGIFTAVLDFGEDGQGPVLVIP